MKWEKLFSSLCFFKCNLYRYAAAPPPPTPAAPKEPRAPTKYDKEQVGTLGVASIFAGSFLLTLAVLPTAVETALEVRGCDSTPGCVRLVTWSILAVIKSIELCFECKIT
jgi:hypothetical protein